VSERNAYFCPRCHGLTLVDHADPGVTPMFLACRRAGLDPSENLCDGMASSLMYPPEAFFLLLRTEAGAVEAPWEWFAETDAQRNRREPLSLRRKVSA
jgi:hypothetical protein